MLRQDVMESLSVASFFRIDDYFDLEIGQILEDIKPAA
jgi:hypothetical protein